MVKPELQFSDIASRWRCRTKTAAFSVGNWLLWGFEEALWGSSWDSRVSRNWVGLGGGKKKARENVVLNRSFGKVLFISTEGFCS